MAEPLSDLLFEREYGSTDPNGNTGVIRLLIGKPYLKADPESYADWRCPYQLIGIGLEKIHESRGVDAIDALLMSFQLVDAQLRANSRWKITWFDQTEYLGLTLPPYVELTDEQRAIFDPEKFFNDAFEDFFCSYKPKPKDASD